MGANSMSAKRLRGTSSGDHGSSSATAGQRQELRADDGLDARSQLMQTLSAQIIPQLLRSHRRPPMDLPQHIPAPVSAADVQDYVCACLALDAAAHETEFARLRSLGHELPALYLELLAPAARQIGRLWETDDCTFPEVTLALWRIQSLVQSLAEEFCAEPEFRQPQRRILLSPAPGSQHTLGFYMLTQFFRRAGWSACAEIEAQPAALIDAVRSDWYDVAAVSVSNSAHLDALSQLIREVRSASLNPGLGIMVGGPLVFDASVRAMLGAEAYSGDALDALRAADRLIQERAQPN